LILAGGKEIDWRQIDWQDLYPRLLLVAAGRLRRLSWRGTSGAPPGAPTANDLVQQAILKTVDGTRAWNRDISLYQHLQGVIYSDTNHLAESEENQTTVPADDNIVNIQDYRASPEMLVLRKIQEENFLIFIEIKDPTLRKLAQLILHGTARSTAELTVALNLSIREVERLKKCLRRATNEYVKYEQELANKLGEPADIA
jgi:hypothetical protein